MQIQCDTNKYKVKKTQIGVDEYQFNVIPKKRNCKLCKKSFDSKGKQYLTWTDDNGYLRSGYFYKEHYVLVAKTLRLIEKQR